MKERYYLAVLYSTLHISIWANLLLGTITVYPVKCTLSQNIMNLNINSEPVTGGADSSILGWLPDQIFVNKNRTCTVVSAPDKIGFICMQRFRLFLGQCAGKRPCTSQWCSKTPMTVLDCDLLNNWGVVPFGQQLNCCFCTALQISWVYHS